MNEQEHLKTLSDIKNLMERSSRFLSLSGLSGIFIGCYALAGAIAAWLYIGNYDFKITSYHRLVTSPDPEAYSHFLPFFTYNAILVLAVSLATGYFFTQRRAKKQGSVIWDASAKRMLNNLLIPLITGGIFCIILLQHQLLWLIAPTMLIFYGLSLINASKYTYNDIRNMGIVEIILGLVAAAAPGYGLILWAAGFGVMHIIYGITMYFKYER